MQVCGGWKKRPSERRKGTAEYGPACCVDCACACFASACRLCDLGSQYGARSSRRSVDSPPRARTGKSPPASEALPTSRLTAATYFLRTANLAAIPPPASDLERRRPYTLPELIDIAQSNNPVTRNAWNDARNAALAAGIAESAFLPFVSAGIVQGWQKSHNEFPLLGSQVTNDVKAQGQYRSPLCPMAAI